MCDSRGIVDCAIGLVQNSVLNLPDGQVKYLEEFNLQKSILLIKKFGGLVEMTFGLVNASFSLPEWQAVKMTFFAPCTYPCFSKVYIVPLTFVMVSTTSVDVINGFTWPVSLYPTTFGNTILIA